MPERPPSTAVFFPATSRFDDLLALMEQLARLKELKAQFALTGDRRLFSSMRSVRAAVAALNERLGLNTPRSAAEPDDDGRLL